MLQPTTLRSPAFTIGGPGVNTPVVPSPETVKAIDDLRRQVEQLRSEVRKLGEKK